MSRHFQAARPGVCHNSWCGTGDIKVGDVIRYVPGEDGLLEHIHCPPEPAPPALCPRCFIVLPLTGECDNCG